MQITFLNFKACLLLVLSQKLELSLPTKHFQERIFFHKTTSRKRKPCLWDSHRAQNKSRRNSERSAILEQQLFNENWFEFVHVKPKRERESKLSLFFRLMMRLRLYPLLMFTWFIIRVFV